MSVKCPACGATMDAAPDAQGRVICPACGARMMSPASSPASTLLPGTPLRKIPTPAEVLAAREQALGPLLAEVKAVRETQQEVLRLQREALEILNALAKRAVEPATSFEDVLSGFRETPKTRRRQKTTLVIDHDAEARQAVEAALNEANVPVRAVGSGNEALAAMAEAKPDVVVMDLALAGGMAGKDLINAIRATMEWADVRIVLHTAVPVLSAHEARTAHGADEVVTKAPGSPRVLVHRIIQLFQEEA
jgi:CheY-like chemotaxis protein